MVLTERQRNIGFIAIGTVLLIALGWYLFFGGPGRQEKLENKIAGDKAVNAVIANQIAAAVVEAGKAHEDSKNAETNLNTSIDRDSSEFSGDFDAGTNAYCNRFECDRDCLEWRKFNAPLFVCPR